jgi:uncharacterized SAM-binding protein YcdF (DUF218 family)
MKTKTREKKRSSGFKKYVFLLCILIVIVSLLSHRFILRSMGEFLVFAEPPQKVDLIVTLTGEDIPRLLGTVEMYKAGYAGRIFRAREPLPDGYEKLIASGGRYIEPRENFRKMLHSLGIGLPAFLTDDRQVESTYHEAKVVRDFLRKNDFKSIMLITSKYHSRRAYLTYKLMLKDDGVKIVSCPTKYDEFDPERWWKVRSQAKKALYEYERLPFYLLRYGLWEVLF